MATTEIKVLSLKLPQRVRAEPGRQTFMVILWSEIHFDLETKSLAMTDFEVTILIHLRSFHVLLPLPRRKATLTAARECCLL